VTRIPGAETPEFETFYTKNILNEGLPADGTADQPMKTRFPEKSAQATLFRLKPSSSNPLKPVDQAVSERFLFVACDLQRLPCIRSILVCQQVSDVCSELSQISLPNATPGWHFPKRSVRFHMKECKVSDPGENVV